MKTVYFIRHAKTLGNLEKRYIGRTDEPLSEEGAAQARALRAAGFPAFNRVFTSPYLRCRETARTLFPKAALTVLPGLRECDFGIFEGKTAEDLSGSMEYAAWLASGCAAPIPGGEQVEDFKARCCESFLQAVQELPENGVAAFVTHGGCIMAILERYALPKRDFYAYHIENGGWARCRLEAGALALEGGMLC